MENGQNNIHINININNAGQGQEPTSIPLELPEQEAPSTAVIEATQSAAERALLQMHRTGRLAIVKTHNVNVKLLRKILLEALPALSVRVVNLGLKILVMAGI